MAANETFELMNMITSKLNEFFGQISYRNYQFENTTQVKKNEQDRKQKSLRKAFRIYKKKKLNQLLSDLNEKEKQKALNRNWEKLSEQQKLKYLETSKLMQKKSKKKKQDQAFRPQADQ